MSYQQQIKLSGRWNWKVLLLSSVYYVFIICSIRESFKVDQSSKPKRPNDQCLPKQKAFKVRTQGVCLKERFTHAAKIQWPDMFKRF